MLVLLDLDNTLIDRTAAFKAWARTRFGETEVPWLVEQDRDGYAQRAEVAAVIAARYRLDARDVLVDLRAGMVEQLAPDPRVAVALAEVTAAGFVPVVVTNGTVAQQQAKLRRTGLDRLVAGWTISEGAGVRKPERRIFELAAASVGRCRKGQEAARIALAEPLGPPLDPLLDLPHVELLSRKLPRNFRPGRRSRPRRFDMLVSEGDDS